MNDGVLSALKSRFRPLEGQLPHSLMDLLHEFGSAGMALLHSCLFVPSFVEIEGSILVDLGLTDLAEKFRAAKSQGALSLAEIEASFNYLELPFIFSNRDATIGELRLLADQIREAWQSWLRALYPKRNFAVVVLGMENESSDVGVQFYELRR